MIYIKVVKSIRLIHGTFFFFSIFKSKVVFDFPRFTFRLYLAVSVFLYAAIKKSFIISDFTTFVIYLPGIMCSFSFALSCNALESFQVSHIVRQSFSYKFRSWATAS